MGRTIEAGRDAIRRNNWDEALHALTAADEESGLGPDDLMLLGDAYWWSGQSEAAVGTLERAYSAYLAEDQPASAALAGALLAYYALRRMAMPVAMGWVSRVEHLLADEPPSPAHAWIALLGLGKTLLDDRDFKRTIDKADSVIELAEKLRIPGVQSLAMSFKGFALIQIGEIGRGTALVDEATVVAMSEGSDLRAACDVYCNTIAACSSIGDYPRAQQWTDEAERWMRGNSLGGYTGICRVHRAELKRLHGSWSEAVETAREACKELERFRLLDGLGFAHYEIGETRRRMGDLQGAEEAFQTGYEHGSSAQPGWSLLLRDKGDLEEASRSIAAAIDRRSPQEGEPASMLSRGRLLPARVEIALSAGDVDLARESVEELEEIARELDRPWWQASALTCRGSLASHEGDLEEATGTYDRALGVWQEIGLPYESALVRAELGQAKIELGDDEAGRLDLRLAEKTFRELGAATNVRRITEMLGKLKSETRERVTRTFMFTDIVTSTDLIGLIGDEAWESLLEWHDRSLREAFRRHDGEEVRHTGDGFFVSFGSPRDAIECAVDVQRSLAGHRHEHGFAPWVRIGVHSTEATRIDGDYAGRGVHIAARVGELGGREDIVVSNSVLEGLNDVSRSVSEGREVSLKGVTEPVVVHELDWH